ncbi:MAG: hypothetical protein RR808_06270 [Akkermansia sp.]
MTRLTLTSMIMLGGIYLIGCPPLMARTWTNDSGAVIDGELVASQEKEIILRLQDGRQVRIPRHVLSGADVEYIRQWESEEKGKSERMMSPSPQEDIHPDQEQAGVLIGDALAQKKWMRPWPERTSCPEVHLIKSVQESDGLCAYESSHFRFESPRRLTIKEQRVIASKYENALIVLKAIPLNLSLADTSTHYIVRISFDDEHYLAAGGEKGTRVSVTPTHLLMRLKRSTKGNPRELDDIKPLRALSQWVAQEWGDWYWLNEGFVQYMALIPFRKNGYLFSQDIERIIGATPRTIRRSRISLPPLEQVMTCRRDAIQHKGARMNVRMKYAALLVSTYFFKMDSNGEATKMKKYAYQVQMGKENPVEILKDGRSWKELEKAIVEAWKKRGVYLRFESSDEEDD